MSRVRRVKYLAVAVLALAALLIVMSRQIGRGDLGVDRSTRRDAADRAVRGTKTGVAGTGATGVLDLSFYDTLGVTQSGGDRAAAPPTGPRL